MEPDAIKTDVGQAVPLHPELPTATREKLSGPVVVNSSTIAIPPISQRIIVAVDDDGKPLIMSQQQKYAVEIYLRTYNLYQVQKYLKLNFKKSHSLGCIENWFERPPIKSYIRERMTDLGIFNHWTKEKWIRKCTELAAGKGVMHAATHNYFKLIGQALGYIESGMNFNAENMQINFTDGNGK